MPDVFELNVKLSELLAYYDNRTSSIKHQGLTTFVYTNT